MLGRSGLWETYGKRGVVEWLIHLSKAKLSAASLPREFSRNRSAIWSRKAYLINIKWFIVAPWTTCKLCADCGQGWRLALQCIGHHISLSISDIKHVWNLWVGQCLWCRPWSNNKGESFNVDESSCFTRFMALVGRVLGWRDSKHLHDMLCLVLLY